MDEHALRDLIGDVKSGCLSRRRFVQTMVGLGVTAPMAAQILGAAGIAQAQPKASSFVPTRRGGGGPIKLLYWAAPTILNPHLAISPKDLETSEIFYEPLADIDAERGQRWRRAGRHVGDLAAQARRHVARRPSLHGGRRHLHLAVRGRSGHHRDVHGFVP